MGAIRAPEGVLVRASVFRRRSPGGTAGGRLRTMALGALAALALLLAAAPGAAAVADGADLPPGSTGFSGTVRFPAGIGAGRLDEVQVLLDGWLMTYPDEQGRYAFEVFAGPHQVRFDAPADLSLVTEYYPNHYGSTGVPDLTVPAGQQVSGVDCTFELGGSIVGRASVPAALTPYPGSVTARWLDGGHWGYGSIAADGSYSVTGLPPGRYSVEYNGYGVEWWQDAGDEGSATAVSVALGRATTVDPTLSADAYLFVWPMPPVAEGDPLQLYAHLTTRSSPPVQPTGTVTWTEDGVTLATSAITDAFSSTEVSGLALGRHVITARYSGDANFAASESDGTFWVVNVGTPVVEELDPPVGAPAGGTRVHVYGSGFQDATAVTFGGVAGTTLQVVAPDEIAVTAPAGIGSVAVRVVTPHGTSAADGPQLTYLGLVTGSPVRVMDVVRSTPGRSCVTVAGAYGIPADATGVVATITTASPSGPGYVVAHPYQADGVGDPPGSTVNLEPFREVANGAFVALTDGALCVSHRGAAAVRLVVDVTGFTLPGSGVVTQASQRLLDTRGGAFHVGSIAGPVPARTVQTVQVAGVAGVPTDATHVLLNVTVTGPTTAGNLRVFPAGGAVPNASVLNYAPGTDKANAALVRLEDGKVSFYSDSPVPAAASPVQVILDVVGWVEPGSSLTGVTPTRVLDTRAASRVGPITGPLAPHVVHPVALAGAGPVPDDAVAVVLNVTAIGPTAAGNLRVYPDVDGDGATAPPDASSLNYIVGRDIPCLVVVALPENGVIDLYSDSPGTVHVAVDVVGYVAAP